MSEQQQRAIMGRFSTPEVDEIEDWRKRQPRVPNLSDTMRRLVQLGLDAAKSKRGSKEDQAA